MAHKGILGRKLGMTQVFDAENRIVPVTVIEAGPCRVVQVKTPERDGYAAVQLSFGDVKPSRLNKPELGHLQAAGAPPQKFLAELSAVSDHAEVSVHQGDVASAEDCRRTIHEVIDLHGRLDILINNAGITIDKTVAKMTEDEWNKVIGVNLSGAFFLAQAALAHMLERGSGRIVMVSSVIGETGAIGQANYAASKAGLFGLTKTLAREACFQKGRTGKLTEEGIGVTVNAITPGYVATEMVETIPEKVLDRIKGSIPMRRLAQPWEVARVVHFLAADASGYITGQVWGVNGGLDM